jgi:leader peptidase (prepilin peptidase) / N-methyltransferase
MEAVRSLEPWSTHPGAYAFVVLLGTLWGSFANVCIYRMPPTDVHPKGRSVVTPGSHCGACGAPVRWYDNVPLLSFLWLRGKCRDCATAFSPRYLLVEAVTGALFGVAWWATVDASAMFEPFEVRLLRFAVYAMFVLVMIVVTFIDLDHQLILDRVTYPSMAVFYGAGLLLDRHWSEGLIGAALGYGVVWLIAEGYFRLTGREGMGLGDGKLLAVVGALLGWRGVVVALFGGSLVGSVLGLGALLLARSRRPHNVGHGDQVHGDGLEVSEEISLTRVEMPFGPYLAIAAMFYLFAEPWVRINVSWLGS